MEGEIHEFEIKVSRADFLADLRKPKHSRFNNGRFSDYRIPNYFTYVLPAGIAKRYEVPYYAGLMEWRIINGQVRVTKVRSARELTDIRCCEKDYHFLIEKSNEKMMKAWLQ